MNVLTAVKQHAIGRLHDTAYGALLAVSAINEGRFDDYAALTIALPEPMADSATYVQPAGQYLRAYYRGSWEGLAARYRAMISYAEVHDLTLHGYAHEQGVNDAVVTSIHDYITRIEIPVR